MTKSLNRTYVPKECITFRKTNESFGGLSNMASGFVLWVNGTRILTSEALYQACRFPHLPEVQRSIIMQASPMTAKMKSKPYRDQSRADWDQVRVKIMRWCLRVKLAQHWEAFGELLLRTGDKPIVEDSRKDQFWGAVKNEQGMLEGRNALGRLLMELREELKGSNKMALHNVAPLDIPDFKLYGQPIGLVEAPAPKPEQGEGERRLKPLGTRRPDEPVKVYAQPARKADLFSEPHATVEVKKTEKPPSLPPYPTYKPTSIPWLPQVPEHWEVKPGLAHLHFKQVKNTGMVEKRVLSLSYGRIVIKPQEKLTGLVPESFETYQIVDPGDIIIRATDLQNDRTSLRVGEVRDRGIITSAYLCLNVHDGMVPAFGYHLIHAYDLMKWLYGYGSGLRQNLDWGDFKRMPLVVPPLAEQHLIVRYLRALDAKVKRYIRTKRTLIAALQEQKQAIIQRAVTRGLDLNVKLKPSGVEWLGEVPEHWEMKRGKAVFEVIDERSKTGKEELLSVSAVNGVVLRSSSEVHMFMAATYVGHKLCWPEDLVVNSLWAWAKGFGFSKHHGIVSTAYSVYRLRPQFKSLWKYLDVLLRSGAYDWDFTVRSRGVWKSRLQLTDSSFLDMRMLLPPAKEADQIVQYVSTETKGLDEALNRVHKEIEVLQEYHTRLIADVVTGAVDVREAAGKLPVDQMIGRSDDQMMESTFAEASADEEEPLSMAAEGEAEYGEEGQ